MFLNDAHTAGLDSVVVGRCLTCSTFWVQAHDGIVVSLMVLIFLKLFFFLQDFLHDFFVTYSWFFNLFTKFQFAIYHD